jgi:hypothetical protein
MLRMLHDVSLTFMQFFKVTRCTKFCGALPTKSISLRLSQRLREAFSVHSTFNAARQVQSRGKRPGLCGLVRGYGSLTLSLTRSLVPRVGGWVKSRAKPDPR